MSNLFELLNPVPSSSPAPGSASGSRPLQIDTTSNPGDDQLLPTSHALLGSPTQRSIIESPLEALANVAAGTTALHSPPLHAMTSLPPLGAGYQNLSPLRPTSSHRSPPLPLDLPRQPERPLGAFSPGLEKYHHASSDEVKARGLSVVVDEIPQTLAPLMGSLPDENAATPIPQLEPAHDDSNHWAHSKIFIESGKEPPETEQREQIQGLDESREAREPFQVQTETTHSQPATQPWEKGLDGVQVKAEIIDSIDGVLRDNPGDCMKTEPHHEPSSHLDEPTRELTPKTDADTKPDVRDQPTRTEPSHSAPNPSTIPKPAPSKKRVASKSKVEKKGTASTIKGPAKRRKIEPHSAAGTPSAHRSGTPASSRASKTPAPRNRKQNSVTPARSSSIAVVNETEEEDEDAEVFCICRKPDDHTWMIACDGPCEDWFHGKCVDMNEKDGSLIDKYICPNCEVNGVGHTTWKPMCRLESCRNPARVAGPKPSKYCSDEHGVEYMKNHAIKLENEAQARAASNKRKKRRRDNYTDHFGNGEVENMVELDDDRSHLRGGVLRSRELKALADGVQGISEFRKLGDGVLSPPRTASPDGNSHTASSKVAISYSPEELTQLKEIHAKQQEFKRRKSMLDHRDRFLTLVRARAKKVLEHFRKKEPVKDICGFDARLSWSDEEFQAWCVSPEGIQSFQSGHLCAPPTVSATKTNNIAVEPGGGNYEAGTLPHKNTENINPSPAAAADDEEDELSRGVCVKRRCERHKTWWKLQQQDVAFERDEVRQVLDRLETEEKRLRKRALIRGLENDERLDEEYDDDDRRHQQQQQQQQQQGGGRDEPRRSMFVDRVSPGVTTHQNHHQQQQRRREEEGEETGEEEEEEEVGG